MPGEEMAELNQKSTWHKSAIQFPSKGSGPLLFEQTTVLCARQPTIDSTASCIVDPRPTALIKYPRPGFEIWPKTIPTQAQSKRPMTACDPLKRCFNAHVWSYLKALPAVAASPQIVGGPSRRDSHAEAETQGARHNETTATGIAGSGQDLDPRNRHVREQERSHAAEYAVGDGCEERCDLLIRR